MNHQKPKAMKYRNLFWGIILIFVGTLAILNNLDVIDLAWRKLWNIWPVFLMLWGISILPVKDGLKLGFVVITLALTMFYISNQAVYTDGNRDYDYDWSSNDWEDTEDEDTFMYDSTASDSITKSVYSVPFRSGTETATLKLDAVAGHFILNATTMNLATFKLNSGRLTNIYSISGHSLGSQGTVIIKAKNNSNIKLNHNDQAKGILKLNNNPVWTIDIDAGAADIDFDMTKFKVKKVNIDAGAADIDLKIGDKYDDVKISIDAGACDITLMIPENSGCKVSASTFLSGKTLKGFNKINGKYYTPNYEDAENHIYIDLESAVSNLKVERY